MRTTSASRRLFLAVLLRTSRSARACEVVVVFGVAWTSPRFSSLESPVAPKCGTFGQCNNEIAMERQGDIGRNDQATVWQACKRVDDALNIGCSLDRT